MKLLSQLTGTGAAIVTPFNKYQEVDYTALGNLIDFIINGGVEYLVTLGTTGETPVLTTAEKTEIIQFTYAHVSNRVPVVVGIGGNDTLAVVNELRWLPLDHATAVLSASPYYNKPSQEGLILHYQALAAASPKPLILYNVPGRTGKNMTAETSLLLAHETANIVGIKEASGDMLQCMEILRNRPEGFMVWSGDDALALPQLACGMDGVISVAANGFPSLFSRMVRYGLAHDFQSAKKLNDRLMPAYELMFQENNPAGIKAILSEMGLIAEELRLPNVPVSAALKNAIQDYLALQS